MRLIDADVLKQHIDKLPALPDGNFAGNHSALKALINMQPTIEPERRWIPVSERLPEDYTDVLVWFEYFRYGDYNCLYQTYGIGDYIANYDWMINHETGWHKLRVIAWMPLPEPYQGESEDKE